MIYHVIENWFYYTYITCWIVYVVNPEFVIKITSQLVSHKRISPVIIKIKAWCIGDRGFLSRAPRFYSLIPYEEPNFLPPPPNFRPLPPGFPLAEPRFLLPEPELSIEPGPGFFQLPAPTGTGESSLVPYDQG